MRIILLFFTIIISIQLTSCGTTEPPPPQKEKPPGYQEDIPWASLADSPWPMAHHDPQNSGRSKFQGPVFGKKLWTFGKLNSFYGGVIVGLDSSIYVVAKDTLGVVLYNLSSQGSNKNAYLINNHWVKNFTAPLVRNDGSIVYFDGIRTISAIKPDGSSIWNYSVSGNFETRNKSLSIDKNGNLYFTSRFNRLLVISPNGTLNWELTNEKIGCDCTLYTISFSPDGKTAYIPGCGVSVVAVDIENRQIKWTFGETSSCTSILVDSDGNIYFEKPVSYDYTKATFISLKPDGTVRWEYKNPFEIGGESAPTIDKFGNLYFGTDTLYSVDFFGKLRWKIGLEGFCDAPIICDESGMIYVTTVPAEGPSRVNLYSVNLEGHINWIYTEEGITGTNGSAAIGHNNTIFIPIIYEGKILTIN